MILTNDIAEKIAWMRLDAKQNIVIFLVKKMLIFKYLIICCRKITATVTWGHRWILGATNTYSVTFCVKILHNNTSKGMRGSYIWHSAAMDTDPKIE